MGFAQHPVFLGAYFDFYEASPVVSTVACITSGHVIVVLGFVRVFFAYWAPTKLATWVFCKPSGYVGYVVHFQPFIEENG
eukprot:560084-Pelagomonas_calceolata.AAC.1